MKAPRRDLPQPAILIVDDYPANLLATEAVLRELDARLVSATSGEEALKHMRTDEFALILMDVHMPVLDGYQTLALIREHEKDRDVPAIFLTAVFNQADHMRRGYELGALDYITKPFDADVLRAKAAALLSSYRRAQNAERTRREERERLREIFIGIVGHDLRNPLAAIQGASHAMRRAAELTDVHRGLERVDRAASRMEAIIADLLDLTRGELADGIPIERKPAALDDICHSAVDEARLAHSTRVIALQSTGDLRGNWDAARLAQAASNLIGNALEHSTVDPITVTASADGDLLSLQVHNGGPPIPPSALATLFEPFHRHGESRGLGLGLYIVREIARAHDGSIDVHSTNETGTTFTMRLPRTGAAHATPPSDIS